jgi:hypothetical protein
MFSVCSRVTKQPLAPKHGGGWARSWWAVACDPARELAKAKFEVSGRSQPDQPETRAVLKRQAKVDTFGARYRGVQAIKVPEWAWFLVLVYPHGRASPFIPALPYRVGPVIFAHLFQDLACIGFLL